MDRSIVRVFRSHQEADEADRSHSARLSWEDEALPPPKFVYTARWPLTLTHVGLSLMVPVNPPMKLEAGESVTLWWFISAEGLRYHHAGSPTP